MAFKLVLLSALLAAANAGIIGAPAVGYASPYGYASPLTYSHGAVGSQTQSVVRSADGNSAISTYSKAVDTAYSSVRKYDTRVSNDAIVKVAAPVAYASAAYAPAAYAAPSIVSHGAYAPAAYAAPSIVSHGAYAPAAYAAPSVVSHGIAPAAYGAAYGSPIAARAGLLGVAYSAAPAVAHISYSNGLGLNYAY